jgi:hypothetical protein
LISSAYKKRRTENMYFPNGSRALAKSRRSLGVCC